MSKILILEDDLTTQRLMQSRLIEKGYEVALAQNGQEGLDIIPSFNPDLIILDVEMPKMNGYTFLTTLKNSPDFKAIPVIVLTSHKDTQPIFEYKGAKEYLIKPVDFDLLFEKIGHLLI